MSAVLGVYLFAVAMLAIILSITDSNNDGGAA